MTPCNQYIRSAMMNFPTLFPRRIDVLAHLFYVNGNGIDWKDGIPVKYNEFVYDTMRFDDLDDAGPNSVLAVIERIVGNSTDPAILKIKTEFLKEQDRLRAERIYRAEHIDVVCSTPDTTTAFGPDDHYKGGAGVVNYYHSRYGIGSLPYAMEPSFCDGVMEALDATIRGSTNLSILLELGYIRADMDSRRMV